MKQAYTIAFLTVIQIGSGTFGQQCFPLRGSFLEGCASVGYNKTYVIPFKLSQEAGVWMSDFLTYILDASANCSSVRSLSSAIMCSLYAPKCREGISDPHLPCRRVCSEFLKRCTAGGNHFQYWMEYITGLCTLLPNNTASSGQCFEPPGFEKYYNASSTGRLEGSCKKLIIPWCQGLGYNHTIVSEKLQKHSYQQWWYKKNYTGDPETDATYGNNSILLQYDKFLAKYPSCTKTIKQLICSDFFPPCFPNEGLAFYTICSSKCQSIETQCPDIMKTNWKHYLSHCDASAFGNTSHGFCKHSSWPKPMEWLNYDQFRERPPTPPSPQPIATAIIIVAVVVPLVVIGLVVLFVVLWRHRKIPWRYFGVKENDRKGFVKDDIE